MKKAFIVLEETAHQVLIEKLLRDDPRLISKDTARRYKSALLAFDAWRHDKPITKTLIERYAAHLKSQGKALNTINQRLAAIRGYARKIADLAADYSGDE
jgi:site-specific recombinase XerD